MRKLSNPSLAGVVSQIGAIGAQMNDKNSLSALLIDSYEMHLFNERVKAEKKLILDNKPPLNESDLIHALATLRAYVKIKNTIPGEDLDLITQAYSNGKKSQKKHLAKSGGDQRAANDAKHQAMLKIRNEYIQMIGLGKSFPRGRLSEFYREMATKHSKIEFTLDPISVKNSIEKLRKELGHSKPKAI